MNADTSDPAFLLALAVLGLVWLLPIFIILGSNKTSGGEKLAWTLLVIFVSWFAFVFYLLLAPIKTATPIIKSQFISFLLTILFGPLGLLYSSALAGLILLVITITVGTYTEGWGIVFVWPICVLIGFFTVHSHNANISIGQSENLGSPYANEQERIEPKL